MSAIYRRDMATCKAAHATYNDAVKALIELVTQIVSSGRKGGCQQGDLSQDMLGLQSVVI